MTNLYSVFGGPSGPEQFEDRELERAKMLGSMAQGAAAARLNTAQADTLVQKSAEARRLAEIARGVDATKPLSQQLTDLAGNAMRAGFVDAGQKAAKSASTLVTQEAAQAASLSLERQRAAKTATTQAEFLASSLNGVTNDAGLAKANALYAMIMGEPSPLAGRPYDPVAVRQLQQSVLSRKEQVELALREAEDADEARTRASLRGFREFRKGELSESRKERERHNREMERLRGTAKAGTEKGVKSPTAQTEKRAATLIRGLHKDLPSDEIDEFAAAAASRAESLRKANKGLEEDDALREAVKGLEKDIIEIEKPYKIPLLGIEVGKGKKGFEKGAGKAAATPIALPTDRGQWKKGQAYLHKGRVGIFNGEGFDVEEAAAGSDDDDDDD